MIGNQIAGAILMIKFPLHRRMKSTDCNPFIKFEAIRYGEDVDNKTTTTRIITVGITYDNPRSPSDGGIPHTQGETGAIYQLGGNGPPRRRRRRRRRSP